MLLAAPWPAKPPKDVAPDRLFRLLSTAERPRWQLEYRLPLAPEVPLSVQALRGAEVAEAHEVDTPDPATATRVAAARLVAASLCVGDRLAFADAGQAGRLTEDELFELSDAVNAGLAIVSPLYGMSDVAAWSTRLQLGAQCDCAALLMSECADVSVGMAGFYRSHRPNRYFGKPIAALTDAQLMAFRAGCAAVDAMRPNG